MSGYDPYEDRLRQVLLAEAQTVVPAGDGLTQIRAKVARRRARLRWLRPGLAVATAAALGGAAFFAFALNEPGIRTLEQDAPFATSSPAPATPTPGRSEGPPPVTGTVYPIWPFTSRAEAAAWQRAGSGSAAWHLDPALTALAFLRYLQAPEVDTVMATGPEMTSVGAGTSVTMGRRMANGMLRPVTVVHMVRLGTGSTAPYVVTRAAGAYTLKITSPGLAAPVRSPLAIRGTVDGVHQSIRVELRTPARSAPISVPATAMGSGTTGWSTTLSFPAPASGIGTLVARTDSDAGDGAVQIFASPVLLGAGPPASAAYPSSFVGVLQGRLGIFDSTSGRLVRYLTGQQPGGGDSEPTVTADRTWVYYVHGTGSCSSSILRVPYAGGSPETVVAAGTALDSVGVGANGQRVAYVRHSCASSASALVMMDVRAGTSRLIQIPSEPPAFFGKPSWAPDGRHLAVAVTGGTQSRQVMVFDAATATTVTDGSPVPCPAGQSCRQSSPGYDAAGRLSYLVDRGAGGTMVRQDGGRLTSLFSLSSGTTQAVVDINSAGAAAIWREVHTDSTSTLMRWAGGTPVPLAGSADSPAW